MQNTILKVPQGLKLLGILISGFLGLVACQSNTQPQETQTGFELYGLHCVNCHGADGKMGLNGAKDLTESPLTAAQREIVIKGGRNSIMPSFEQTLTAAEIKAVAEYTTVWKK